MTFGYNDEVVLLTKLIADEDLQFPAKIEAKVDWFTCKDICIPQEGSVDIEIKEGQSLPSIYSDEIKFYLDKVPTEFSHNYVVQRLDDKFFIQTDIKEGLNFQNVYFYPKEYGLTNYVEDQVYEKNQNSFVLEIEASKADLQKDNFEGVIETFNGKEKSYFEISYPLKNNIADKSQGLFLLITFAFIGGLILNIMPCVFPILSIKILRFVEHSENSSNQTYKFGVYYALGACLLYTSPSPRD